MDYEKEILRSKPIVQCITNIVTAGDCANILLAAGACATMAHHPMEMEEIQSGCQALVCNLGATENFDAMQVAVRTATALEHPIVIDPVGCGGSSFRRDFFFRLKENSNITCIRGNQAEIRALADNKATVTGVDANVNEYGRPDEAGMEESVKKLATETGAIVVASGETDYISDGEKTVRLSCGHPMMSRITGAGCMSSALLGAYLSVDKSMDAVIACCKRIGRAGELAAGKTLAAGGGSGTFRTFFIDEFFVEG